MTIIARAWLLLGFVLSLSLVAGCGKRDGLNRGGKVSGTVSLDGKLIPGGVIQFFSADGVHAPQVNIMPNGSYLLMEPPLGPCKVVIRTSHLRHLAGKTASQRSNSFLNVDEDTATGYAPVPGKYESPESTDLVYNVLPGDSIYNIDLKSSR